MTNDIHQYVHPEVPPSGPGCRQCEQQNSWWFHLRRCATCGEIGCCDDSLNQHASKHAALHQHPIIRSFEPGEDWFWDYRLNTVISAPELVAPLHHPRAQGVPGPRNRVPADWQRVLLERGDDR